MHEDIQRDADNHDPVARRAILPFDELAAFLAQLPSASALAAFRFSREALERADDLLDKSKAGTLTSEESRELDRFILLDDMIGLIKTRLPPSDAPGA